MLEMTKSMFA